MHILLTGASSGIGRELAILLDQQHTLSLCGRSEEKLQRTLDLLNNPNHLAGHFCVSDFEKVAQFVKQAEDTHGEIDILINCAGLNSARGAGHELGLDEFDWMMKINCYAPIKFMQAVVPSMKKRKQGTLINILSTTCLFANSGIAGYTASKAALDHYCKVMRKELREDAIKVLSIYPGGVDTDFRESDRPQYLSAKDVAQAIMPLTNGDSSAHIHELVIRPQCEENFA